MYVTEQRLETMKWEQEIKKLIDKRVPRAPTHVTPEGVLLLPRRIVEALLLEDGGGVSFVDKGDHTVEMMADDVFLDRYAEED